MERWLFRWRERCSDGTLRERNKVIGTVEEYPTKSKKLHEVVTRLRVNINTDGPTELTSITMAKAVDHYTVHELADCGAEGKATLLWRVPRLPGRLGARNKREAHKRLPFLSLTTGLTRPCPEPWLRASSRCQHSP